jgi:hypothetical protein
VTYPEELDTDDIEELASYIERRYPTEEIRIHDTGTIHFAYWDKSHRVVSATLLDYIQAAGYRVLHTALRRSPEVRPDARGWSVGNTNRAKTTTRTAPLPSPVITARRRSHPMRLEPLQSSHGMIFSTPVPAAITGLMARRQCSVRSSWAIIFEMIESSIIREGFSHRHSNGPS